MEEAIDTKNSVDGTEIIFFNLLFVHVLFEFEQKSTIYINR